MAADAMMPGPAGENVRCFRRRAANVAAGDWLPDYAAYVAGDAATDPDDGSVWVALADGRDIRFTSRGKVWLFRTYDAPAWMRDALADYRTAVDVWEQGRESGRLAPTSVAGVAGSAAAMYQLTDAEYLASVPRPRYADFVADHAARVRESDR